MKVVKRTLNTKLWQKFHYCSCQRPQSVPLLFFLITKMSRFYLFPYVASKTQQRTVQRLLQSHHQCCCCCATTLASLQEFFFSSHDFWDPGNFNFMICSYPLFSSVVRSSTLSLNSILRINVTFFVSVLKIVKNICKKKSLKIVKNGKRFS